jgi:curved DNA-binding protein CbpA
MKDYYYILGINQTATNEELKKAYRKLSLKFHPDKNEGDEFFTERFKEIQEAYEILSNDTKRKNFDFKLNNNSSQENRYDSSNFNPEIEYFKTNRSNFEINDEITFSWRTINANKVTLKPFGAVQAIGEKTYKIKDIKNSNLTFEIIAENSNINKQIKSSITLSNKTYNSKAKEILFPKKKKQETRSFIKKSIEYVIIFISVVIAIIIFNWSKN